MACFFISFDIYFSDQRIADSRFNEDSDDHEKKDPDYFVHQPKRRMRKDDLLCLSRIRIEFIL